MGTHRVNLLMADRHDAIAGIRCTFFAWHDPKDIVMTLHDSFPAHPGAAALQLPVSGNSPSHLRIAVLLIAGLASSALFAQGYPARPVRMLVPFPGGGTVDFICRLFAQRLTELWGQQVVIESRPRAAGIIGTEIARNGQVAEGRDRGRAGSPVIPMNCDMRHHVELHGGTPR